MENIGEIFGLYDSFIPEEGEPPRIDDLRCRMERFPIPTSCRMSVSSREAHLWAGKRKLCFI
jgi:hypothetical protein